MSGIGRIERVHGQGRGRTGPAGAVAARGEADSRPVEAFLGEQLPTGSGEGAMDANEAGARAVTTTDRTTSRIEDPRERLVQWQGNRI